MPRNITSNLIIKSSLPAPTGDGLAKTAKQLDAISRLMDSINRKQVTVTVNLLGDKQALGALKNILAIAKLAPQAVSQGAGGAGKGGGGGAGAGGSGGLVNPLTPTGRQFETKTVTTPGEEGDVDTVTNSFRRLDGAVKTTEKSVSRAGEVIKQEVKEEDVLVNRLHRSQQKLIEDQQKLLEQRQALTKNRRTGDLIARGLVRTGFEEQAGKVSERRLVAGIDEKDITRVREFTRAMKDGKTEVFQYNEVTDDLTTTVRGSSRVLRDQEALQRASAAAVQANTHLTDLQSQGYVKHKETLKSATVAGMQWNSSLTELRRITGSPLLGNLAVEIAKVDSSTGNMIRTTVRANEAIRLLGDRFSSAVAKVGLWFAAVSTIFLVANAARTAATDFKELSSNTVFLARVGDKLGTETGNFTKDFAAAKEQAKLLTNELVRQSVVLGTSATAAQRASAIFLRSGQDRREAAESTRVALIASSIAELEAEDASRLLAAAQSQFNIQSKNLIFTLDSLNTLSNKYAASTDDLLQSISRSGKVFADNNGTLEQLAATTAIIAQVTKRTGAEIGNALKTISSRLAAPEVSRDLITELGVSLQDSSGKTKNFTKILLELQIALSRVSAAERERSLVTIAGARQVNILRNAVDNVIEIVIAEAKALRDEASAEKEAVENAKTLEAALGRLRAQFTAMVNSSGAAFETILTSTTNTITVVLKLANAFDGLVIKLGIAAIALIAVRVAIARLSIAAGVATTISFLSTVVQTLGVRAAASAAALQLFGVVLTRTNIIAAAVTFGLFQLVDGLRAAEEASVREAILSDQNIRNSERLAEAKKREAQATKSLAQAINEQIAEQRRLNKEGRDSPQVKKNIERLAGQIDPKLTVTGFADKDLDALQKRVNEVNRQAAIAAVKQRESLAQSLIGSFRESGKELTDLQNKLVVLEETQRRVTREAKITPPIFGRGETLTEINAELDETKQKIAEVNGKLLNTQEQFNNVAKEIADISSGMPDTFTPELLEANKLAEELAQQLRNFKKFQEAASQFSIGRNLSQDAAALKTFQDIITKLTDQINKFGSGVGDEFFKNFGKTFTDAKEEVTKLEFKLKQLDEFLLEFFKARAETRGSIFTALREAGDAPGRSEGAFGDVQALQRQVKSAKELASLQLNEANTAAIGVTDEERLAFLTAQREAAIKSLMDASKGEVDLAVKVLETETAITKEKKKQNEETLKALGLLSSEDKAIVLAQASFFNRNPNAKISAEQQFFGDERINKIQQQFFGGRLAKFDPAQRFDQFLLNAGVGPIEARDLAEQEKLMQDLFNQAGGRDKFFNQQEREAAELHRQAIEVGGGRAPATTLPGLQSAQVFLNPTVNIDTSRLGLDRVVDAFEQVAITEMDVVYRRIIGRIETMEEQLALRLGTDVPINADIP